MPLNSGFDFQTFVKQNEFMLLFSGVASIIWLIFFSGYSKNGFLGSSGYLIMWLASIGMVGAGAYGYMLNNNHQQQHHTKHHPKTAKAHYANSINPYYEYY